MRYPKALGSCPGVIGIGSLKSQSIWIGLAFRFLENRSTPSAQHVRLFEQEPRSRNKLRSWLCLLIPLFCIPLYGIDRDRSLDQLYHTGWTICEGAPGEVNALAQTTDGYLWLGTATGLFRFDGIRFEPYKPQSGQAFPQRSVASLFAVPDGGLWVGYWYGGVSFIKNGTVTEYGKEEGLPSRHVFAFARDRKGADLDSSRERWARSTRGFTLEKDRNRIGGSLAQPIPFSWITPAQFGWGRRPVSYISVKGGQPV